MQLESKRNILKYILAFGSVQGLNIAISIVRNKLVALILGPNGMGINALYTSGVQFLQNATNLGLDKSGVPTISKFVDSGNEQKLRESIKQIRSLFVVAAILAFVVCIIFSWLLSTISFGDTSRTLHFIALSPVASFLIIASGETMILKALRRLKRVAALSMWNVVATLCISVPMFYFWGSHAIIPSLILVAFIQALITIVYSYSVSKPEISLKASVLKPGLPIVRLGIAFVIASAMTSGAEFYLRSFINTNINDYTLGIFNAAYMIAFTYAGMVFAAIDSEYFPRLSKIVSEDKNKYTQALLNSTIQRQIKMSLLVIIPMIVVMEVLLPYIIPLLFSSKFVEAVPLAQIILLATIFRAVYLPIGYVSLAKGDSRTFLIMDSMSAVFMIISTIVGFHLGGFYGIGYGLVASHAFDMINYVIINRLKYDVKILNVL